jgi:hypothetical protein
MVVELDRWVHRLSGAPQETISRSSTDSFFTDKMGQDQWTSAAATDEVGHQYTLLLRHGQQLIAL